MYLVYLIFLLRMGHFSRIYIRSRGFCRGYSNAVDRCDRMIAHMNRKLNNFDLGLKDHIYAYSCAMRYCK